MNEIVNSRSQTAPIVLVKTDQITSIRSIAFIKDSFTIVYDYVIKTRLFTIKDISYH